MSSAKNKDLWKFILPRLISYPFALFTLWFAFFELFPDGRTENQLAGTACLVFAVIFIVTEVLIFRKRRRQA